MAFNRVLGTALVCGMAFLVGCEDKKTPTTTSTAGKSLTDAAKGMADKGKEAVKEGADKAKEAVKEGADKAKEVVKEGTDKAKEAAGAATAGMMDKAKETVKSYIGEMGNVNTMLEKIKSPADATAGLKDLGASAVKVGGFSELLNKLPADMKSGLMKDNMPALDGIKKAFTAQVERITKDSGLNGILGDTLKKFKMFE